MLFVTADDVICLTCKRTFQNSIIRLVVDFADFSFWLDYFSDSHQPLNEPFDFAIIAIEFNSKYFSNF